jgi:hypothetical protein
MNKRPSLKNNLKKGIKDGAQVIEPLYLGNTGL